MKKTVRFIAISLWILFTRSYDAYATFQFTPDLTREANPLVSILGMSWTPLLSIIGVLSLLVIYAFYQYLFKPYSLLPEEKGYTFSQFVGYVYTGKKQAWHCVLYKLPYNLKRFTHIMGALLTPSLAFAGLVSTVMWLLINYTDFYPPIHSAKAIYATILIGIATISYKWYKDRYKEYQTT